jgi:hypothetical protein
MVIVQNKRAPNAAVVRQRRFQHAALVAYVPEKLLAYSCPSSTLLKL